MNRNRLSSEYKKLFSNNKYRKSLIIGIVLALLAAVLSSFAIGYADKAPGNFTNDFFLDSLPQINFFWFRVFGTFLVAISVLFFGLIKPKYIPILLKSTGLMYITRAFFIYITHLKFYPTKVQISSQYPIFNLIPYSGNDLFFSGHVALPFLAALVFWNKKYIRNYFFLVAVISGVVSLFAKTHYSIDIFAAPFITYGVFKISEKIFKKDFNFIKEDEQ